MSAAVATGAEPTPAADRAAVLCRFGEIFLKGQNRGQFERLLRANIARALGGLRGAEVEAPHARVLAWVDTGDVEEACARLGRVFGLVSLSPAAVVPARMDAITGAAVRAAEAALARDPALARGFRVSARRSDKRFGLTSNEIAAQAGARIAAATSVPVDLAHPALVVGIEVGFERAFVHAETRAAPGGLPVGMSGRALLLLSGGIDSPVAGWLAAKRGLALDAIYFHSPPFVGDRTRDKVLALGRQLARWQAMDSVTVVGFTEAQKRLRDAGPPELAVVLYRRMMMRVADRIAERAGAAALVTGENLGQVASQTLPNLGVIDRAATRLVLRPLLTYDKSETVALARRIDTFDVSTLPYDDCCSLFVPAHPATSARLRDVEAAEARLDVAAEADAMAAAAERVVP